MGCCAYGSVPRHARPPRDGTEAELVAVGQRHDQVRPDALGKTGVPLAESASSDPAHQRAPWG
jgi:hypothetical protein